MANTLQGFVDTTTLHGPAEIYYAKSLAGRFLWSVIFVAMISLGTYFTYLVIDSYVKAEIQTLVSSVATESMVLPEVAICYSGAIDAEKLFDSGLSKQAVRALYKQFEFGGTSTNGETTWNKANRLFNDSKSEILEFMTKRDIADYGGLIEYASFDCSKLIQQCSHDGPINCSCAVLKSIPHELFGTCYILPNIEQNLPYILAGWTVVLKAPLDIDSVQHLRYRLSFVLEMAQKYDLETLNFYKLPLNRSVVVALQATTYNRLKYRQWPRPRAERCYERIYNYTYLDCYHHCYTQRIIAKKCNCMPFTIAKASVDYLQNKNYSICWPDMEYNCTGGIVKDYTDAPCYNNCLPLCHETVYGITVSYADYNAEQMITEFGLAGKTQGIIHMIIGYSALRHMNIDERDTFGLDDCVSNIGGMFGLWLGGSAFTILHLLATLCGCCEKRVTHRADRRIRPMEIATRTTCEMKQQLPHTTISSDSERQ